MTGCGWDENGWGWGPGGAWQSGGKGGKGGWGNWGSGWSYATQTETVTVTESEEGGSVATTESQIVVAQAVSGDETRLSTVTDGSEAAETGGSDGNDDDSDSGVGRVGAGEGGLAGIKAVGVGLAAVLLAVGLM